MAAWLILGAAVAQAAEPETTITADPGALSNGPTPDFEFEFESSVPTAAFERALDGAPFGACGSPHSTASLSDGAHDFEVRAADGVETDSSPASHSFTVHTDAPGTTISTDPGALTNDPTADFEFSASEPGSSSECRVDGGIWQACSSPHSTAALADGNHSFQVRATDPAGNVGLAATHGFRLDSTPPQTTIAIPLGPKLFTVEARDRAGNEASETRAYVIDPRRYGEFVNSQDPIAFFRVNEELGSSAMLDRSGNGNDGTYQGDIALRRGPAIVCERRPHPPRACELDEDPQDYAAHFPARDGHGYANGITAPATATRWRPGSSPPTRRT